MNYEDLKREKRTWYKAVKKSYCPVLNEDVCFTSKGFRHLLYDGLGHARSRKERMYRLGLLPLVIPVLKTSTSISGYEQPKYSKKLNKAVEYWTLKAVVGRQRVVVTVILRRVGAGKIHFYSVWKRRDKKNKKTVSKRPSRGRSS